MANLLVAVSFMAETIAVAPIVIFHVTAFAVHMIIEDGRRFYMSNQYIKLFLHLHLNLTKAITEKTRL